MSKPFSGITFCPTAISEDLTRSLSRKIIKLGGAFSKDLTKTVNVLIVGSVLTNKYRFVVQHRYDIVLVDSQAIESLYDLWLSGEDITMAEHSSYKHLRSSADRVTKILRDKYELGALQNFVVFIGRIASHVVLSNASRLTPQYLEHLAIQQRVTTCNTNHFIKDAHLSNPTVFVTDTPHGARVDAARIQGIPIVHPKWLYDLHLRRALLDHSYYLLEDTNSLPWEEVGKDACHCWNEVMKYREEEPGSNLAAQDQIPHRISNKFRPDGDRLWNSVMTKEAKTPLLPMDTDDLQHQDSKQQERELFHGYTFLLYKFPSKHEQILKRIIEKNGGVVSPSEPAEFGGNSYFLVPSDLGLKQIPLHVPYTCCITEFFIERCLHYKKLLPLDPWCQPFYTEISCSPPTFSSSNSLNVAITGFQGVELLHLTKILNYLTSTPSGINFTEYLNYDTDVLIINLASLTSIPQSHPLWQNKYRSMFEENRQLEQNQVFRNSMKRKIEFIKTKHSIPVVTPGFIMELFTRMRTSKTDKTGVYLNDANWCVLCPKGSKNQFRIELAPVSDKHNVQTPATNGSFGAIRKTSSLMKEEMTGSRSAASSIKDNRREFLEKVRQSSVTKEVVTKRKFHESTIESIPSLPPPSPPQKIARVETNKVIPLVERSSSWGKMMSEDVKKVETLQSYEDDNSTEIPKDLFHTQVTYGTAQSNTKRMVSKRLTRQQTKEIDI